MYFYDKVLPKMHLLRSAVVPEEEKKMIDAIEAAEEKLTDLVDGMGV